MFRSTLLAVSLLALPVFSLQAQPQQTLPKPVQQTIPKPVQQTIPNPAPQKTPAKPKTDFIVLSTPLPQPRAFHGSAVLGGFLYVFGGTVTAGAIEKPSTTVLKAPILPNGNIGQWTPTTPMPQPRHYIGNSTLVINDTVYILGGAAGPLDDTLYRTAIYTRPGPDGTLEPWKESAPLGTPGLVTVTAVSTPGHVHTIGGKGPNNPVSEVWTNAVNPDGSISVSFPGPKLPRPLWFHSAGAVAGRVYIWGGLPTAENTGPSGEMLSAPILASGTLGPWRVETQKLKKPFFRGMASVAGPYLFTFCPSYGLVPANGDVWFCRVTASGPGQWMFRETDIKSRIYSAAATDYRQGTIFVSGGRIRRAKEMVTEVSMLRLSPEAREMAEQDWTTAQMAHADTVSAVSSEMGTPNYAADAQLGPGAVAGFLPYAKARTEAAKSGKPLVLYFNLDGVRPCKAQNELLADPKFRELAPAANFAWVDSKANPQLVQQLGVYRVPTWVFYDRAGAESQPSRRVGVLNPDDFSKILTGLK